VQTTDESPTNAAHPRKVPRPANDHAIIVFKYSIERNKSLLNSPPTISEFVVDICGGVALI
jgi:hypothetical protein